MEDPEFFLFAWRSLGVADPFLEPPTDPNCRLLLSDVQHEQETKSRKSQKVCELKRIICFLATVVTSFVATILINVVITLVLKRLGNLLPLSSVELNYSRCHMTEPRQASSEVWSFRFLGHCLWNRTQFSREMNKWMVTSEIFPTWECCWIAFVLQQILLQLVLTFDAEKIEHT